MICQKKMILKSEASTRESKRFRHFATILFLILSLLFQNCLFLVNPVYASTNTWDFTTSSNYIYDDTKIEFSAGQAQLKATNSPSWYDNAWQYRKQITIDHTKVSTNLTDFPVLISLNSSNFDFSKSRSDGYDIRFTSSDGTTLLSFERERHDAISELAEYWVKVSSLSSTIDTVIYIYYTPSSGTGSTGTNAKLYSYQAGNQYEWFLDQTAVSSYSGISFYANNPTKDSENPVLEPAGANTATWDYNKNYNTVLQIDGTFKTWYAGNDTSCNVWLSYATSSDGILWTKPNLGLVTYGGNANNNILNTGFNPAVVYDSAGAADRKYVMTLEWRPDDNTASAIYIYISPDGITWNLLNTLSRGSYLESKEIIQRPDGRWIAYYSFNHPSDLRKIGGFLSDTTDLGGSWTDQGTLIESSVSTNQKYTIGIEYINGLYYGFVGNYNSTTLQINMDLYVSRDGLSWTLKSSSWVPVGGSGTWDNGMIVSGKSLIRVGNSWQFYYSGFAGLHNASCIGSDARLGFATIGYGRIGSVEGTGTLTTTAFQPTDKLYLNMYDPDGGLKVEVLDATDDSVLSGFSKDDFDIITADTYSTESTWNGQSIPTDQSIKIKFYFNYASNPNYDNSSPTSVWDSNYEGVWHFPNGSSLTANDSTSNGYTGTINGTTVATTGKINGGALIQADGDYISNLSFSLSTVSTFEFWYKPSSTIDATHGGYIPLAVDDNADGDYAALGPITSQVDSEVFTIAAGANKRTVIQSSRYPGFTAGNWYFFVGSWDGSKYLLYINGVAYLTAASVAGNANQMNASHINMGGRNDGLAAVGTHDEYRISSVSRSAGWIATEYANQNSPSTFSSISAEQLPSYSDTNPTVQVVLPKTFAQLSGFSETATKNGGEIKYQLSNDGGTTWYWYNSGWTTTTSGYTEANTASDINSNISTFSLGGGSFLFKAFLNSDGAQLVQLDSIDLEYQNVVPTSAATSSSSNNNSSLSTSNCSDQSPGSKAPWLYGAVAEDSGSIKLFFTPADNPVNKYVLEYGTKSGEYQYGVQDMGINSRESMTFLVKSLAANTTYYFRVRGGNGCATGSWSDEISVKTQGLFSFNQLKITEFEIATIPVDKITKKSAKSKEQIEKTTTQAEQGYMVKIKVKDINNDPVSGAKVTIHSKVQTTTTNKDGIATFSNVEKGEHRVIIAYNNFQGEQKVNLAGDVKEFDLNIQVKEQSAFLNPQVIGVIGIFLVIVIFLVILLIKAKRRN